MEYLGVEGRIILRRICRNWLGVLPSRHNCSCLDGNTPNYLLIHNEMASVRFRNWDGRGIDWINLMEVRDRWRALGNAMMNFWFP